jgi:DNA-binding protein H-NS
MAGGRQSLSSMSVEALLSLRDNIGRVLVERGAELREQLRRLEIGGRPSAKRTAGGGKGRKIPPKYRDPENRSNVWAGRGAVPRWMAEQIKAGAKREDFLIGSPGAPARKKRSKRRTISRAKAKKATMRKAAAKSRGKRKSATVRTAKVRARRPSTPNVATNTVANAGSE